MAVKLRQAKRCSRPGVQIPGSFLLRRWTRFSHAVRAQPRFSATSRIADILEVLFGSIVFHFDPKPTSQLPVLKAGGFVVGIVFGKLCLDVRSDLFLWTVAH